MQAAGRSVGRQIIVFRASTTSEIDAVFAGLVERRVSALVINSDGFFTNRREQLVALAARYSVPTSYWDLSFVEVGGLMSYGTDGVDLYRQAGRYVGRILKGDRPADLPVQQPTNFEFAINLKTAKALGLEVPPTLVAIADEIIE
jgi:putative ABC transport system substrate-binding protein